MKRVLLTDDGAREIEILRDWQGGMLGCDKREILDAFCLIADLVLMGRDKESEIGSCVDDLLMMMYTLKKYNDLLDALTDTSDNTLGRYEFMDDDTYRANIYNTVMNEREVEAINALYGEQLSKLSPLCDVEALTMQEAAILLNMTAKNLDNKITEYHNNKRQRP